MYFSGEILYRIDVTEAKTTFQTSWHFFIQPEFFITIFLQNLERMSFMLHRFGGEDSFFWKDTGIWTFETEPEANFLLMPDKQVPEDVSRLCCYCTKVCQ